MFDMRKVSALTAAGALAASVALVGCGGQPASTGNGDTKAESTATNAGNSSSGTSEGDNAQQKKNTTGVDTPVPWADVANGAEACEKAKLGGDFIVPDTLKACGIEFSNPKFSYAPEGIAKATYEQGAAMVDIRKGVGPAGTVRSDDSTGYMGEAFPESWEVTSPDGQRINCYGKKKGAIIFAQWYDNSIPSDQEPVTLNGHTAGDPTRDGQSDSYSVHALGLGGEDIPMTESELLAIVAAVK